MRINTNKFTGYAGKNKKGEWWTDITGNWKKVIEDEDILILRDIMTLAKVKTFSVDSLIENLVLELDRHVPDYIFEEQTIDNESPLFKPNHLVRYLQDSKQKLTKLEIATLETILGQGSFYEECWSNEDEGWQGQTFIGWYIDEKECPGCRGALASLKKKGIIDIGSDDVNGKEMPCYWTNYMLDFVKDGYYHQLDIPEKFIRK